MLEIDSLQVTIDNLIQQNQMNGVRSKNNKHRKSIRQSWKTVNTTSGRKRKNVSLSSLFALEEVNNYFQEINSDVLQGTILPVINEFTTFKFLSQQKRTAAGPDGPSHWFWREFVEELAPIVTSIFNLSITSHTVPKFLETC